MEEEEASSEPLHIGAQVGAGEGGMLATTLTLVL